jgi:hypothetical protein
LHVVAASTGGHHPSGPVQTGDGGSITGTSTALEAVGLVALVGAGGALVLWRRSTARS